MRAIAQAQAALIVCLEAVFSVLGGWLTHSLCRLENDQVLEEATGKERNLLYLVPEIMRAIE